MQILPPKRPQQSELKTRAILAEHGVTSPVALLGMRGYYRDTMGVRGKNDRKIYDDAIFLVSTDNYISFNANCDPAAHRSGIANLAPGAYLYRIGIHGLSKPLHRRYVALVQAMPVTVARDGGKRETGYFGINIHKGSRLSTSSLGCQTIWPGQWGEFIGAVERELRKHSLTTIPYLLIEATA